MHRQSLTTPIALTVVTGPPTPSRRGAHPKRTLRQTRAGVAPKPNPCQLFPNSYPLPLRAFSMALGRHSVLSAMIVRRPQPPLHYQELFSQSIALPRSPPSDRRSCPPKGSMAQFRIICKEKSKKPRRGPEFLGFGDTAPKTRRRSVAAVGDRGRRDHRSLLQTDARHEPPPSPPWRRRRNRSRIGPDLVRSLAASVGDAIADRVCRGP